MAKKWEVNHERIDERIEEEKVRILSEYFDGVHACEYGEPFDNDASDLWKDGYFRALGKGDYRRMGV